jgi:hypothetical protein
MIGPAIQRAQQAIGTIPIVMVAAGDPVASGFVASLARPGGNITGFSSMAPELVGKQLELLKEVVPKVSRVALLVNPGNPASAPQVRHAQDTARALGVRLQPLEAGGPGEIDFGALRLTWTRSSCPTSVQVSGGAKLRETRDLDSHRPGRWQAGAGGRCWGHAGRNDDTCAPVN